MSKKRLMYKNGWQLEWSLTCWCCLVVRRTPDRRSESWHNGTMPDGFHLHPWTNLVGGTVDLFDPYANSFENIPLPPKKPPVIFALDFCQARNLYASG